MSTGATATLSLPEPQGIGAQKEIHKQDDLINLIDFPMPKKTHD
jgi:hypothetical protein